MSKRSIKKADLRSSKRSSGLIHTKALAAKVRRVLDERDELREQYTGLVAKSSALFWRAKGPKEKDLAAKEMAGVLDRLRTTCAHYAELFDLLPVGYLVINGKGQIQESNQTCATLLGVHHTLLSRRCFTSFLNHAEVSKLFDHLRRCQASREPVATELILRPRNRPSLPVELISAPMENCAGQYRTVI